MSASVIIGMIETALPTVIQLAKLVVAALEGNQKAQTAIAVAVQSVDQNTPEQTQNAAAPAPVEPAKRGPGRPKKSETTAAAPAASGALDIGAVTSLCSEKMKELGGKLNGDEAAARQMVKEAVKGAAGVERLKEVPADRLAAVRDAVAALDVPEQGADDGELEEF